MRIVRFSYVPLRFLSFDSGAMMKAQDCVGNVEVSDVKYSKSSDFRFQRFQIIFCGHQFGDGSGLCAPQADSFISSRWVETEGTPGTLPHKCH
jgi:hypothetical protein